MSIDINLGKRFGDNFLKNVSLSNYSWLNLVAKQNIFIKPKIKIIINHRGQKNELKNNNTRSWFKYLFRDNGVKGAYKIRQYFSYVKLVEKDIIEVGAATLDRKVNNYAKDNNLGNLEFLSCIPGSIGGAIIMNSGCLKMKFQKF